MTFITGYIYNKTVHIVADSAESSPRQNAVDQLLPEGFITTMGESSLISGEYLVMENANKIYNFNDKMLAAFAGSVGEGVRIIEDLKLGLINTKNVRQYVLDFFESTEPTRTQFVIGFIEDGEPYMFYYRSTEQCRLTNDNLAICSIGVNYWIPYESMKSMVNTAFERNHAPDDFLITAISFIQTTTQGMQTLEHGVGGHINGGFICPDGVKWAKDTTYLLYSSIHLDKANTINFITKFNRDDTVFVRSNDKQRMFKTEISKLTADELNEKWGHHLRLLANSGKTDYYVLLSYDTGICFLVNNHLNSCKVLVRDDGQLRFSPDLVKCNTEFITKRDKLEARFILLSNLP